MAPRISSMGSRNRLAGMLSQQRITGTDAEIAVSHETNRQSTVKEILVHIFFMLKFQGITGPFTTEEAEYQYLGAHGDDEAAHCAPGQVVFFGQAIQDCMSAPMGFRTQLDDLSLKVENLFAHTDEMHGRFNKADSRAEAPGNNPQNGLRGALEAASNHVAQTARFARFNRTVEFFHFIEDGFRVYRRLGIDAFTMAIADQQAKLRAGELLTGTTRQELIFILETYRATLASSSDTLDTVLGLELRTEELWREYRAIRI